MPQASRLQDISVCPGDSHGGECCPHSVQGPATTASPNVFINERGALRIGDSGVHAACCGSNTWKATKGSATVLVNGRGAVRYGDSTQHCGGAGHMTTGSADVHIGG